MLAALIAVMVGAEISLLLLGFLNDTALEQRMKLSSEELLHTVPQIAAVCCMLN